MEAHQGKGQQQLTILYSGNVSIFDNVPADKAQAVMLLLSKDISSSKSGLLDCGTNPLMPTQQPQLSAKSGVVEHAKPSYPAADFPPQGSLTRTLMPTTDDRQITQFIKKQAPTISKRSQAELPFARKASLARFLEKRKDRVLEAMKITGLGANACADRDDVEVLGSPAKRLKLPC